MSSWARGSLVVSADLNTLAPVIESYTSAIGISDLHRTHHVKPQTRVTILGGIPEEHFTEMSNLLSTQGNIRADARPLLRLNVVNNGDSEDSFDSLYLNVLSDGLIKIHEQLKHATGTAWIYSRYSPFIEVARLKRGRGQAYIKYTEANVPEGAFQLPQCFIQYLNVSSFGNSKAVPERYLSLTHAPVHRVLQEQSDDLSSSSSMPR